MVTNMAGRADESKFRIGGVFDSFVSRHAEVQRAIEEADPEKEQWARSYVAQRGWDRDQRGFIRVQEEKTHNLIPSAGLDFILNLMFSTRTKVVNWYHGPFTSNWTPVANAESNWSGAASGPLATELATAQFTEVNRQPAVFDVASGGSIATSSATQITIATGVTNLSVYGPTLNSSQVVGYNSTDQVLIAATRFTTPKTGLGETDVLNLSYTLTAASI